MFQPQTKLMHCILFCMLVGFVAIKADDKEDEEDEEAKEVDVFDLKSIVSSRSRLRSLSPCWSTWVAVVNMRSSLFGHLRCSRCFFLCRSYCWWLLLSRTPTSRQIRPGGVSKIILLLTFGFCNSFANRFIDSKGFEWIWDGEEWGSGARCFKVQPSRTQA